MAGAIEHSEYSQWGLFFAKLDTLGNLLHYKTYFDSTLISPVCQASILAHELPDGRDVILFSNPESSSDRINMTVKMSLAPP